SFCKPLCAALEYSGAVFTPAAGSHAAPNPPSSRTRRKNGMVVLEGALRRDHSRHETPPKSTMTVRPRGRAPDAEEAAGGEVAEVALRIGSSTESSGRSCCARTD